MGARGLARILGGGPGRRDQPGGSVNVLRSFLRTLGTTPLVFPVLLVVAVVSALAAPWTARRTGLARLPAALLLFSFGAILAITLTPGIGGDPSAPFTCKGLVPAPSLSELWSLTNENGQNVLLYVPLGLFIGLIPRRNVLVGAGIAAAAMPFAIEGFQALLPGFARSCDAWDVVENVLGLAIGLVLGSLLAGLVRIGDQPESDRP
jgi:glycopeptide antibiotics resistance protein